MKSLFALTMLPFALSTSYANTPLSTPRLPQTVVEHFLALVVGEPFDDRMGLNRKGQLEYFSAELKQLAINAECDAEQADAEEPAPYTYADSTVLFDRWDTPTSCSVVRARTLGLTASVEVDCSWGPETDHASGHLQLYFLLIRENGVWEIHNVFHGAQEDAGGKSGVTSTDFAVRLNEAAHQSSHPQVCQQPAAQRPPPADR